MLQVENVAAATAVVAPTEGQYFCLNPAATTDGE